MGQKKNSLSWIIATATGFWLVVPMVASAQHTSIITPTITLLGGGEYSYSYDVTNSPTSDVNIGVVLFDIDNSVTASNLVFPAGYLSLYTPNQTPVEFDSALQPDGSNADITPGMTDTFSFTSYSSPGVIDYATESFDDGSVSSGFTVGPSPSPIPEPASLSLVTAAGVGLLGRKGRRTH